MRPLPLLATVTALSLAACTTDPSSPKGAEGPRDDSSASPPVQPSPHQKTKLLRVSERIPDQYIVVLEDRGPDVAWVANAQAAAAGAQVGRIFTRALRGYVFRGSEAAAIRLLDDPHVKYVEEDGVVHLDATQLGATWGLDRVDQRFRPLDGSFTYGATGAGVNAYIIDTGIRPTHVEIAERATIGFDSVGDGRNGVDCQGHGTHVAATVGGSTYGVAKQVSLTAVRVLDCDGSGTYSGVIAGIDWVTANRVLPAVANMSLGGGASQAVDDAVTASVASGVVYAVAAGNGNADACGYSPARTPAAITVGAIDGTDARADYSNLGPCLDLFAPGSNVTSAWNTSDTATNTISGTSMASPHVAGAAALYLSAHPTATPAQVAAALTAGGTPGVVLNAGLTSPNILLYSGFIGGGGGADTTPPTVAFAAPADGSTLEGSVTLAAEAADDTGVSLVAFSLDGLLVGSTTTAPFQKTWDASTAGDGPHILGAKAFDAAGNASAMATVAVTVNNPGVAGYDPLLMAPKCGTPRASCDTGSLVDGRALLGPELHASNTIRGSCVDGTSGRYHDDESVDRIRVHTLDGSAMEPGKTVQIDVTVYAWSTGTADTLDLYYAPDTADPVWIPLTSLTSPGGGARTLSAQYTLPQSALQAVRANYRYYGSPGACTSGAFDDHDDLVFAVAGVGPGPHAAFIKSCSGLTCRFTDTSADNTGVITGRDWTFGDGTSSSARNPVHTFSAPGTYTVALTATDDGGASDTRSSPVTVFAQPPQAQFSASCNVFDCSLYETSQSPEGTVTAWSWSFGDGTSGSERSPTHRYGWTGTYPVTLTVTDSFGQTASTTQNVVVTVPAPAASFTWSCSALRCSFTDTSTTQYGTIVAWNWKFGSEAESSEQNPTHIYYWPYGNEAWLTVTNSYGVSSIAYHDFYLPPPVITLSVVGTKVKGVRYVDLFWSGAGSPTVKMWRAPGIALGTTDNDGQERTTVPANGTYSFSVCQDSVCSNSASVTF